MIRAIGCKLKVLDRKLRQIAFLAEGCRSDLELLNIAVPRDDDLLSNMLHEIMVVRSKSRGLVYWVNEISVPEQPKGSKEALAELDRVRGIPIRFWAKDGDEALEDALEDKIEECKYLENCVDWEEERERNASPSK